MSFLGDIVWEEYEFFCRFEILSKDRKLMKIVKEVVFIEIVVVVGMYFDVDFRFNFGMSV